MISEETRLKLSRARKGKKFTEKHKENMRKSYTPERRLEISKRMKGRKFTDEHRRKIALANIGKKKGLKVSKEVRQRMREAQKRGSESHSWKGGVYPVKLSLRFSLEYKLWREEVFKRDDYTCIWCGYSRGEILEADHIIPFSSILNKLVFEQGMDNLYEKALKYNLLWDINNGRTLCKDCHKRTHTYGNGAKIFKL